MPRVLHRERANGVHPMLLAFLSWWEREGKFNLTVLPDGGLRTDESKQRRHFSAGVSHAETLKDTPHGRGVALDVAPVIEKRIPWDDSTWFKIVGEAAESQGLVWGGRWRFFDGPHLELSSWRTYPYPPQPWGTS